MFDSVFFSQEPFEVFREWTLPPIGKLQAPHSAQVAPY